MDEIFVGISHGGQSKSVYLNVAELLLFMEIPYGHDLTNAHVAILGIPFDVGTHPRRIGSRDGPQAIRDQSYRVRRFYPPHADLDVLTELGGSIVGTCVSYQAISRQPTPLLKRLSGASLAQTRFH